MHNYSIFLWHKWYCNETLLCYCFCKHHSSLEEQEWGKPKNSKHTPFQTFLAPVCIWSGHCWVRGIWDRPQTMYGHAKKYLDTICNFPTTTNITNVRSRFGLINQVSYTERVLPFSQAILKPGRPFNWDNEFNQLFEESKSVIIGEIDDKCKPISMATFKSTVPVPIYPALLLPHRLEK